MKKNAKQTPPPAAPANEPLDPLSPEGLTAMKTVTFQPLGILVAPQDIDALLGIIRTYAAEIERLKGAK